MTARPAASRVDADGIAWLTLDKPGSSANTLAGAVLHELQAQLARSPQAARCAAW